MVQAVGGISTPKGSFLVTPSGTKVGTAFIPSGGGKSMISKPSGGIAPPSKGLTFAKKFLFGNIGSLTNEKVAMGTVPLAGGGLGAGVGLFSKAKSGVSTLFQRMTANPLAGSTIGGVGKRIAGRALGVGLAFEAFQLGRGKGLTLPDAQKIAAIAINPLAGIAGIGFGGAEQTAQAGFNFLGGISQNLPQQPFFPSSFGGVTQEFVFPAQQFTPAPSVSSGAPSISIGGFGGGGGIPPEFLLLLLGAGGAGFALGRRKRKKKRKKKKK